MSSPSTTSAGLNDTFRGVLYLCAGLFIFAFQDVIIKLLSDHYPVHQLVFARGLIALPIIFMIVHYESGLGTLATRRPGMHALRSFIGFGAFFFYYLALPAMPLTAVVAIWFTSPLFITALSVPVLGERVGPARWLAVLVGFGGMLVIVQPGSDTFKPEMGIIVASAFVFALGITYTRRLSRTETVAGMFTWTTVVSLAVFGPLALLSWKMPEPVHLGAFAALGLIGGAAHYLVGIAYRNAPAAVVAPQEYVALVWGALIGWFMWGDVPSAATWAGAAIVAAAGGFIAVRESRAERRRKASAVEAAA